MYVAHIIETLVSGDYSIESIRNTPRITRDALYLAIARLIGLRGTCLRPSIRERIGCVIVQDNRIVSIGYAGSPPGSKHCLDVGCDLSTEDGRCLRTQHAEANAISWAAREGISLKGAHLYVTVSPCFTCAKLIISAGITGVIFGQTYREDRGLKFLSDHLDFITKVTPESECWTK